MAALERVRRDLRFAEADAACKEAELMLTMEPVAGYELDDWDEAMEYARDAVKAWKERR